MRSRNKTVIWKKSYLISFFCVLCGFSLFGQIDYLEGYVIKNNQDTIYGLIKLGGGVQNRNECIFKKDADLKATKFLPSDILGYRFLNGKYYVAEKINYQSNSQKMEKLKYVIFDRKEGTFYEDSTINENKADNLADNQDKDISKNVFLEYLINGNVDVYIYYDDDNTPQYFIKKGEDSLIYLGNTTGVVYNQWNDDYVISKKEYIGLLNYVLNDCEGIQSKVAVTSLNNESLIKLAKYYHEKTCNNSNEACIIYEKTDRNIYLSIIPILKYSTLNVTATKLNGALDNAFTNQNMFSYGLNLKLSNFQYVSSHLKAQIGLFYQDQNFKTDDNVTNIKFTVLEFPLEVNYSFFLNSKVNPFLGFSVNPYYRINKDLKSSYYNVEIPIKTFGLDASGIAGIDYNIGKKVFLTAAFQYKIGGAFYKPSNIRDNSTSNELIFRLGLGYVVTTSSKSIH